MERNNAFFPFVCIRQFSFFCRIHHCLLRRYDDKKYIGHHDAADHRAKMNKGRPAAEYMTVEISKTSKQYNTGKCKQQRFFTQR